jgi:hypothetical protein
MVCSSDFRANSVAGGCKFCVRVCVCVGVCVFCFGRGGCLRVSWKLVRAHLSLGSVSGRNGRTLCAAPITAKPLCLQEASMS